MRKEVVRNGTRDGEKNILTEPLARFMTAIVDSRAVCFDLLRWFFIHQEFINVATFSGNISPHLLQA